MKTSNIFLKTDGSKNKEPSRKEGSGKLLKATVALIMLAWIMLLSSCIPFVNTRGQERRGDRTERQGRDNHHGEKEHHDKDDHHN